MTKERNIFDYHQLKIAKATLKMTDAGANIMGGMSKAEARKAILRIEGKEKGTRTIRSLDK